VCSKQVKKNREREKKKMKSALTSSNIRPIILQPATNNRERLRFHNRTHCSISMANNTIKTYHLSNLTQTQLLSLKSRPRIDFTSIFNVVSLSPSFSSTLLFSLKWVFFFTHKNCSFFTFSFRLIPLLMMFIIKEMKLLNS
jgi:hypothetical protein